MEKLREQLITKAKDCVGVPYLWGGDSKEGFDCSGLMQYLYAEINIDIPRTIEEQFQIGEETHIIQEGDLLFFGKDVPNHVAMYIGDNKILEAPYTGKKVRVVDMNRNDIVGVRKILN